MSRFNAYLEQVETGTHMGYEKDPEIFAKDKTKAKEAENKAIESISGGEPTQKAEMVKKIKEPGIYAKALINLYKSGKKEFRYTDVVKELLKVASNGKVEYNSDYRGFGAQNLCYNYGGGIMEKVFDKQPNGRYKFKESRLQEIKDGTIQPFKGVKEFAKDMFGPAARRRAAERRREKEVQRAGEKLTKAAEREEKEFPTEK